MRSIHGTSSAAGIIALFWAAAATGAEDSPPLGEWTKLSPLEGTPPSPRLGYEGACTWDSKHGVLVRYGGHNQGGGGEQGSEVWVFEPGTARWRLDETDTSPPGVCCAQQNVFDPVRGRSIRFSAFSGSHGWQWFREIWLNDSSVWTHDVATSRWRNLRPLPAPNPRPLRCASWDSEHEVIVLFGGEGSREGTFVYDPYANTWTRMRPTVEPAPRSGGNMAYDPARKLHVLFGGQFEDDPRTWTYDLGRNEWRESAPRPMPPTDENDAVLAWDPAGRAIVAIVKITEGKDEDARHRLETWSYDAAEGRWRPVRPKTEPDPSGNRARVLAAAPALGGVILENCTHPPQGKREQQVWLYRHAAGDAAPRPAVSPAPPGDLRAAAEKDAVVLAWSPSGSPGVARYAIWRGEGPEPWRAAFERIGDVPVGSTSYRDEKLRRGTVYRYFLRAIDGNGREGEPSLRARAQPRVVEDAVVSVISATEVEIAWTAPPGESVAGYRIERAAAGVLSEDQLLRLKARTPAGDPPAAGAIWRIGPPVRLTEGLVTETRYADRGADLRRPAVHSGEPLLERSFGADQLDPAGRPYPFAVFAYRVIAVNALGVESGPSPPFFTIPAAPRGVLAREDGAACRLRWRAGAEKDLRGYRVYRLDGRYDSSPVSRLTADPVAAAEFADATAGKSTRRYHVVAVDALGQEGFPSSPVWFEREWKRFYEPFTKEWHP